MSDNLKYDYSDKYYLKDINPKPHYDVELVKPNSPKSVISTIDNKDQLSDINFDTPPNNGVTKEQLKALYTAELAGNIPLSLKLLSRAVYDIYPTVLKKCTYESNGQRHFVSGGTPALKDAVAIFKTFVINYENGRVSFVDLEKVLGSCHNNGTFADIFILDCLDETDAINFLDELAGLQKNKK